MDKYKAIIVSVITISFILFAVGIAISYSLLIEITGAIIVILIIILRLKDYKKKEKTFLENIENKDQSILPQIRTIMRKREIIPTIISIMIVLVVMTLLFIMLKFYLFSESNIDIDKAVKDGCAKLNMGEICITDPSKIIVPYDVNKDGIAGGINDTFSNLMNDYYNCTGACIKKRCGCPG